MAPVSDPFVIRAGADGSRSGPLRDVRVAVKDNIDVAGLPTGAGNPDWARSHDVAATDAPVVAALRAGGAEIVGKAHTEEFAYSLNGDNAHFPPLENPAAPGRLVGGSSSGPAAAVAAGLADLGLGTDTAGSVRVPASYCGLYGLRPTWGRLSAEGVVPLAVSFDTVGLMGRDVAAVRRAFAVLVGEAGSGGPGVGEFALVEGVLPSAGRFGFVGRFLHRMGAEGSRSVDLEAAIGSEWVDAFAVVQGAEFWAAHGAWITQHQPSFTAPVGERVALAASVTAEQAAEARRQLDRVRSRVLEVVGDSLLVIPTAPGPPPVRGEVSPDLRRQTFRFTTLASIAGLPVVSVPVAFEGELPLGVSIIGPAGDEARLLGVAGAWQDRRRVDI